MLLRSDVDFGRWRLQKANITSLCDDLYKKDLLGNIIEILDTNGNTMIKYTYDAWGNHTVTDYTEFGLGNINPIRYRGYYYDTETGLYYLKSRYYDPQTGRFISMDDISYLDPETIGGVNLYMYCLNNPVMNIDPSGCLAFTAALFIAIGIDALIGALSGAVINGVMYAIEYAGTGNFSWRAFGATITGGAVSGLITGAVAGAMSILGGGASLVFGIYTAAGAIGELASSVVENLINGNDITSVDTWIDIGIDTAWGAFGGALGGLMEDEITAVMVIAKKAGKPLSKVLSKVIRKAVKEIVPSLLGEAISDFSSWYFREGVEFFIEKVKTIA